RCFAMRVRRRRQNGAPRSPAGLRENAGWRTSGIAATPSVLGAVTSTSDIARRCELSCCRASATAVVVPVVVTVIIGTVVLVVVLAGLAGGQLALQSVE